MNNQNRFSRLYQWLRGLLLKLILANLSTYCVQTVYADVHPLCDENAPLCTEVLDSLNYDGKYTGHDEPAVLFYSDVPGSGNSNVYMLTLPKDPPRLPKQDGTGGTFNFQLHPAFWFGMAMCDDQSAPNPGAPCTPNSDSNIFDNQNPGAPDYIGKHPGTALMEMQFYPPAGHHGRRALAAIQTSGVPR